MRDSHSSAYNFEKNKFLRFGLGHQRPLHSTNRPFNINNTFGEKINSFFDSTD
jgi:hypothetical protein